jgi:hypothetical protein
MAQFRNDHGEDRVVPTLGYSLVAAGQVFTVPDSEIEHWIAGGFTLVDQTPAAPAKAAPKQVASFEGTASA